MSQNLPFDFDSHAMKAEVEYKKVRPHYKHLAEEVERIVKTSLRQIKVYEIQSRAKDISNFVKKACKTKKENEFLPKYETPLKEISDMAGVRVIAYFPKTLKSIEKQIYGYLDVLERVDIGEERFKQGELAYQSIHFLVKLPESRKGLPENDDISDLVCEIQIRTILQHAWAEMEHDIQYKSTKEIPDGIRRRFLALAGMIEIADREFQAIQDEDESQRQMLKASLEDELTQDIAYEKAEDNESNAGKKIDSSNKNYVTSVTARDLVASGNFSAAIAFYTNQIAKSPNNHLLYAGRSKAKFLAGDRSGAIEDIKIAVDRVPNDINLRKLKQQYEEGIVLPTTSDTLHLVAQLVANGNENLKQGNAEEAFGLYSKAQQSGGSFGLSTFSKAMARALANDLDGASYFLDQLHIYSGTPMEINILGLKAIIGAVSNSAPVRTYKRLEECLSAERTLRFDFNQSPLRHLEYGFIKRYDALSRSLEKVFELLSRYKSI